ncbi:hypothetical protein [Alkaliflexus imshenetskii]|uniref:hypothetical protein n=1 Tax=Alkaliflexus imshenetskii TaxID=286730 RepID=UPI0005C603B4|nr:hypothetical protein [Alkaliflexus imshenetskii]
MCKLQTVSFVKLAQGFEGQATYVIEPIDGCNDFRRVSYREAFTRPADICSFAPLKPPYRLSMDRTNWQFGSLDINILMLSVCYKGVAIPLLWKTSSQTWEFKMPQSAKNCFDDYIELFGCSSISGFVGDREFIGDEWFGYLILNKVPFYIRLRET